MMSDGGPRRGAEQMLQATSPTGERVAFFPPAGAGGRDVYLPLDDAAVARPGRPSPRRYRRPVAS